MKTLIKHAIDRDYETFVNEAKIKLEATYEEKRQAIKNQAIAKITEGGDDLGVYGLTDFKPGMDYIASGPYTFLAVTDDIAAEIEKKFKKLKIDYARAGLNFVITA